MDRVCKTRLDKYDLLSIRTIDLILEVSTGYAFSQPLSNKL